MNKEHFVYVIQSGCFVKIGKAKNPNLRLKELQTGSPNKLLLLCTKTCESNNEAYKLEAILHNEFKEKRGIGEWFSLVREDVVKLLNLFNFTKHNEFIDVDNQELLKLKTLNNYLSVNEEIEKIEEKMDEYKSIKYKKEYFKEGVNFAYSKFVDCIKYGLMLAESVDAPDHQYFGQAQSNYFHKNESELKIEEIQKIIMIHNKKFNKKINMPI